MRHLSKALDFLCKRQLWGGFQSAPLQYPWTHAASCDIFMHIPLLALASHFTQACGKSVPFVCVSLLVQRLAAQTPQAVICTAYFQNSVPHGSIMQRFDVHFLLILQAHFLGQTQGLSPIDTYFMIDCINGGSVPPSAPSPPDPAQ